MKMRKWESQHPKIVERDFEHENELVWPVTIFISFLQSFFGKTLNFFPFSSEKCSKLHILPLDFVTDCCYQFPFQLKWMKDGKFFNQNYYMAENFSWKNIQKFEKKEIHQFLLTVDRSNSMGFKINKYIDEKKIKEKVFTQKTKKFNRSNTFLNSLWSFEKSLFISIYAMGNDRTKMNKKSVRSNGDTTTIPKKRNWKPFNINSTDTLVSPSLKSISFA